MHSPPPASAAPNSNHAGLALITHLVTFAGLLNLPISPAPDANLPIPARYEIFRLRRQGSF
jgi:hypothetical protein